VTLLLLSTSGFVSKRRGTLNPEDGSENCMGPAVYLVVSMLGNTQIKALLPVPFRTFRNRSVGFHRSRDIPSVSQM
jgi:hypothetical protein